MNEYGFIKISAAVPKLKILDTEYNVKEIITAVDKAKEDGSSIVVTPELSLCANTAGDLIYSDSCRHGCNLAISALKEYSNSFAKDIAIVVGTPVYTADRIYKSALVILNGKIMGVVPTEQYCIQTLPSYVDILNEKVPFGKLLFEFDKGVIAGIVGEEDLYTPVSESSLMALRGANLILNVGSGRELSERNSHRETAIKVQSSKSICAYVYVGSGVYESTTDTVCSGATFICENGEVLEKGERFVRKTSVTSACIDFDKINYLRRTNKSFSSSSNIPLPNYTLTESHVRELEKDGFSRKYSKSPFISQDSKDEKTVFDEIISISVSGLAKRLEHTGLCKCVIGISGGLDSTLALLICTKTMALLGLANDNILAITMPGFGTTDRTYTNALNLMKYLGVTVREINIKDACIQHFKDISHDSNVHDITYENTQARERTQILMDIANKEGAILVGTGDLSELALGWCTYNGDHMSMYSVNTGIPKTLIKHIIKHFATLSDEKTKLTLADILDTPVSPELLPPSSSGEITQKTEDKVGPYELSDFFLYHFLINGCSYSKLKFLALTAFENKYDEQTVEKWLTLFMKRFFVSQFKRSCLPDGPQIFDISLSPRGGLCMPSDASFNDFIK